MENQNLILSVKNLDISFRNGKNTVHAVRGASFDLEKGCFLAIVGESGSGKTVTCKSIVRILPKSAKIQSGEIIFKTEENGSEQRNLLELPDKIIRKEINGKKIAMVFQDPMSSLDPTMNIGGQITEGMRHHFGISKKEAWMRAEKLLNEVGIPEAGQKLRAYPHQLSGGMRQRVVIAAALSCDPDILICDEPTTALDVTVQKKILRLIKGLQKERKLSVIYITHDLAVVAETADRIAVMYAGKVVETGTPEDIFFDPRHPYTQGLLASIPGADTRDDTLYTIWGMPPDMSADITGDAFAERNPYALNIDFRLEPPMMKISDTHSAATWLLHPDAPQAPLPGNLRERIRRMKEER